MKNKLFSYVITSSGTITVLVSVYFMTIGIATNVPSGSVGLRCDSLIKQENEKSWFNVCINHYSRTALDNNGIYFWGSSGSNQITVDLPEIGDSPLMISNDTNKRIAIIILRNREGISFLDERLSPGDEYTHNYYYQQDNPWIIYRIKVVLRNEGITDSQHNTLSVTGDVIEYTLLSPLGLIIFLIGLCFFFIGIRRSITSRKMPNIAPERSPG